MIKRNLEITGIVAMKFKIGKRGFTMIELMLAVAILAFTITAILVGYVNCSVLTEHNRKFAQAMNIAREFIEERVKAVYSWDPTIFGEWWDNGGNSSTTFIPNDSLKDHWNLDGSAVIYMDNLIMPSGNLIHIKVIVCWRDRNGRVVGEDKNLNASVDVGEDINGNGQLDSPVTLETTVARR
jgi:prepilin-type N-terminal cleavage/methylation domain-containing protein